MPGQDQLELENDQPITHLNVDTRFGKEKFSAAEWKYLLSFIKNKELEKTVEAKMQIQMESVESERREIPNKNRKKLMLMINSRRLPVYIDTDTVFSTFKFIHGYWYVELFCHVISDFLFVRCMQRE